MSRTRTRWLAIVTAVITAVVGFAPPALAEEMPGAVVGQLTAEGAPVEGAYVELIDADYNYVGSGQTDSTGTYQILDVPAGSYKLYFNNIPGGFAQWAPQQTSFDTADLFSVAAGTTTTVNESMRPHGAVTGHVYNPDGTAAPNVEVAVHMEGPEYGSAYVYTDAEGKYLAPYVPAGNYKVSIRRDFNTPEQYADNVASSDEATVFAVAVGETTTVDQTFVALGAIAGTVTDGGVPLADVYVRADKVDGYGYGSAITGPDGTYRMEVWPGSYTVEFRLPHDLYQYAPRQLDPAKAGVYVVEAGADTILNEKARRTGTVSGQVTDSTGAPVPDASVELIGKWASQYGSADANGNFQLRAFPGTYHLKFGTGHGAQWSHGKSTADTADLIQIVAGTNVVADEVLAEPATLVVTARDGTSNEPVAEFCVDLGFAYECTSTGTATIDGILPGRHTVRTVRQEDDPYLGLDDVVATLTSNQTTAVELSLTRQAAVTTVITDAKTGAPVANACLELVPVTAPMSLGTRTGSCSDTSGNVTVDHLRSGEYKPFVWVTDGVHGKQWVGADGGVGKFKRATTVTLTAGETFQLPPIRLDKAGTITGTITDEVSGEPIKNAVVGFSTFNAGYGGGGNYTDTQGRYTLTGLGPYNWTLNYYAEHYAGEWSGDSADRDRAAGVRVRRGSTTTYDTALGRGTTVTGKVLGPTGNRATSARVTVLDATTGDEIGAGDVYGSTIRYTVAVKGKQRVKLQYFGSVLSQYYSGWVGGPSFETATVYGVPDSGIRRINVTMIQTEP